MPGLVLIKAGTLDDMAGLAPTIQAYRARIERRFSKLEHLQRLATHFESRAVPFPAFNHSPPP